MFQRRVPEFLRHAPTPGIRGFAILAGIESFTRGILISVFPIVLYRTFGAAETVSEVYFLVGAASLAAALVAPWLSQFILRRRLFVLATAGLIGGAACAAIGGALAVVAGLTLFTISTVVVWVCFNAYVMDYVERADLGESETLRLFYSAAAWTVGPYLGIWLMDIWAPGPFVVSVLSAGFLMAVFLVMRLGNGKTIVRAHRPAANPLAYLPRFLAQPRLIVGWSLAVLRSCGWWVYVVYVPIYVVENGYSEQVGGLALSVSNGFLFMTPLMLRWMRRNTIRRAVLVGLAGSGSAFVLATVVSDVPVLAVAALIAGTVFLVLLDICAGLPFLMAVKPSERTEMAAVYATYRDVSGVVSPGVARAVLEVAPLPTVFAVIGVGLIAAVTFGTRLHPRLGHRRILPAAPPAS